MSLLPLHGYPSFDLTTTDIRFFVDPTSLPPDGGPRTLSVSCLRGTSVVLLGREGVEPEPEDPEILTLSYLHTTNFGGPNTVKQYRRAKTEGGT